MAHFYLTPTRIWELLSGSISAIIMTKYNPKQSDILWLVGLSAVLFSIFIFNSSIPFPSAYTLVPVIGTSMILLFSSNDSMVTKALSNKLLVHIGLISYSTYLWHQPLLAFYKINFFETQTNLIIGSICALSFTFGWLSTKFFENPFRDKSKFSRKSIFSFSIIALPYLV